LSEQAVLEGQVSIQAALQSGSRVVHTLYIRRDKRGRALASLERMASERGVPVQRVEGETIDALTSGKAHGGVAALAGPRRFLEPGDLLGASACPFVVLLDGIEDPFNFGAAVRALYAAGADGLVVRPRNWMSAAGIVARSSAGATEWMPTAVAETASDAADFYRAHGLTVACAAKDRAVSIYETDLAIPLFCVIGGEKRGITRSFADRADFRLSIPYGRPFPRSLGTASAVAVLAFEVMRQRAQAGTREER
jgi:23S rRNA (guanosine2251-2'-O)-methyltransferase